MPVSLKGRPRARRSFDDPEEFRATLVEHLEELRDRIIRALFFLVAGWIGGWYLEPPLYTYINDRINGPILKRIPKGVDFKIVFHQATEPFLLKLKLSFMIGLVIAFPFIVVQLWGFVAPGLKKIERKAIQWVAPFSVLLFAMGATFCGLVLPSAFTWFTSYLDDFKDVSLYQEAGSMVFFVLKMVLAFGAGFQLPLVVFVLGKIGLLTPETLIRNWRQATAGIFVIAMVVTPSNDPLTMLMMAVPLSILFIISIYAVKISNNRSRRKKKRDEDDEDDELNDLD